MPKTNDFLRPFFQFLEGFGFPGFQCWTSFWFQNSIFFALFLKLQFFIDFRPFWQGFGRVWGGFGEGLEGFGEDLGRAGGGFWVDFWLQNDVWGSE